MGGSSHLYDIITLSSSEMQISGHCRKHVYVGYAGIIDFLLQEIFEYCIQSVPLERAGQS